MFLALVKRPWSPGMVFAPVASERQAPACALICIKFYRLSRDSRGTRAQPDASGATCAPRRRGQVTGGASPAWCRDACHRKPASVVAEAEVHP